jgi:hypothetical protein
MLSGNVMSAFGLGDHVDLLVMTSRGLSMCAAVAAIGWLILRPQGRSPVRGAMLAFVAVVALGPVVQPWYLLWALPLAAASGLQPRRLRWVLLIVAGFTLYGLCETSATADNLLDLSDGLAMIAAVAAVVIAISVSPRERALVLGTQVGHGLIPDDAPSQARRDQMKVKARESR